MERQKESSQPSTTDRDIVDAARQTGRAENDRATGNPVAAQDNNRSAAAGTARTAGRYPLLRRISITSLVGMLITVTLLVFLYRQDQLAEHQEIAKEENEKTATHLTQMMHREINTYLAATEGLDANALQVYPGIHAFGAALKTIREHNILKTKLYNLSGITIFSNVAEDIGKTGRDPEMPQKALASGTQHRVELRDTFRTSDTELRNRHILATYVPLTHAGEPIGVLEIYSDITPSFERVQEKTAHITLVVLAIFAALYSALFASAFRADRTIARWQKELADDAQKLAENEARLWTTINSALDGVISIDAESRLIGFNPAAEAIFGWRKAEVIGKPMTELLIPERYREAHRHGLDNCQRKIEMSPV